MTDTPLAQALERAAQEPAQRPAFYRALMNADVFVIGHTDLSTHGQHTIPAGPMYRWCIGKRLMGAR
ncbi:MAG: SseB family protein [Alloalcanivorax sp.]